MATGKILSFSSLIKVFPPSSRARFQHLEVLIQDSQPFRSGGSTRDKITSLVLSGDGNASDGLTAEDVKESIGCAPYDPRTTVISSFVPFPCTRTA